MDKVESEVKHKGSKMEHSRERIIDLMRAYDKYIATCQYIKMTEVYECIVNMPSKRFWVSDIRAALVVSAIMRGEDVLDGMLPLKREMYSEIYRRVCLLRTYFPTMPISELCAKVVIQPAPKFYLTAGTAKIMVCKARKEWIRRKKRRLHLC